MNLRPSGYEPDELPGCSTPRKNRGAVIFRAAWYIAMEAVIVKTGLRETVIMLY